MAGNETSKTECASLRRRERERCDLTASQPLERSWDGCVRKCRLHGHGALHDCARMPDRGAVRARDTDVPTEGHGDEKLPTPVAVEVEAVVRRVVARDQGDGDDSPSSVDPEEALRVGLRGDGCHGENDG